MDVRIETFMRDVASDRGKSADLVAEASNVRLATAVAAIRREAGAAAAPQRERAFLADLETRLRDEMSRYPGTRTETHLATVLAAVHGFTQAPAPGRMVA
jgi:hypothetical protein